MSIQSIFGKGMDWVVSLLSKPFSKNFPLFFCPFMSSSIYPWLFPIRAWLDNSLFLDKSVTKNCTSLPHDINSYRDSFGTSYASAHQSRRRPTYRQKRTKNQNSAETTHPGLQSCNPLESWISNYHKLKRLREGDAHFSTPQHAITPTMQIVPKKKSTRSPTIAQ